MYVYVIHIDTQKCKFLNIHTRVLFLLQSFCDYRSSHGKMTFRHFVVIS